MPRPNSTRLVIDASVARAAGGIDTVKLQPKACRDFLISARGNGHQLVLTFEIRQEWNKHQSQFAREWRSSMVARKQVAFVKDEALQDLTTLLDSLDSADMQLTDKQINAMLKDALLVESAIAADRTVAALDETVRELFAAASIVISELKEIIWVNPIIADEEAITWLQNGAPPEAHRQLQNYNQSNQS